MDVIGIFDEITGPVLTSGDVAERTGCSRDTARRKLAQLERQGLVESRETAGRIVYWRSGDTDATSIDPTDPIFVDRPTFSSGSGDLSSRVDELLYGSDA
ncbi:helix-turn-helix domain-containing protein [Halovivax limisalsi]|uniref:helix-turn-helix domain-containing protein n=1 Tax=Halovivax limisalsi TaxID=1453760 RepID=UPI001FFCEA08|nr:helix-turn-helix domain-containing protein [Halovivax limisalsi]